MENSVIKDKRIAIVGGGPAGLTLARLLQMNGANVKVYERDYNREVRVQGATLDLHEESGLEALRRAGLIDAFYENHRPEAGRLAILDKHLEVKQGAHSSDDYDEHRPEIDRGPLRNILLDSLKPDTVVWDSQFSSLIPKGDSWRIEFKNGSHTEADLVIATDGANSKVRPYLSDIKPVYSGVTIVEGTVYHAEENAPTLHRLLNGGKIFAFGDEQSLILSAKGDGNMSFYTGCKVAAGWVSDSGIDFADKKQVFEWFKQAFGSWNTVYQELFQSDEVSFVPRPQYHFPLDQSWETLPNLTMIGDAAHRMPPYAGEGVNMAMQDAFELSECLLNSQFKDISSAIHHFERSMCKRASEVTKMTLVSTEMLHAEGAAENLIKLFNDVA